MSQRSPAQKRDGSQEIDPVFQQISAASVQSHLFEDGRLSVRLMG